MSSGPPPLAGDKPQRYVSLCRLSTEAGHPGSESGYAFVPGPPIPVVAVAPPSILILVPIVRMGDTGIGGKDEEVIGPLSRAGIGRPADDSAPSCA